MDFLYPLRVMTGRQLTPIGIRRAKKGLLDTGSLNLGDTTYSVENDEIHKDYISATPIGVGHFTDRRYTMDGRLKMVSCGYGVHEKERTVYDPPGRFIGKKVVPRQAAA